MIPNWKRKENKKKKTIRGESIVFLKKTVNRTIRWHKAGLCGQSFIILILQNGIWEYVSLISNCFS